MSEADLELSRSLAGASSAIWGAERWVGQGAANGLLEATALLDKAVAACCLIRSGVQGASPEAREQAAEEIARIRTCLGRIDILLNSAAEFHAGWARLVEARAMAYGPDGGETGLPADSGRGRRVDASG